MEESLLKKEGEMKKPINLSAKTKNRIFFLVIFLALAFLIIISFKSCGESKQEPKKTEAKPIVEMSQNPYLLKIDSLQAALADLQKQLDECNESKVKKVPAPVKKVMKKRKQIPPVVKAEPVFVPAPNVEVDLPERGSVKNETKSPKKEKVSQKKLSVPKKIEVQKNEPEDDNCPTCPTKYGRIQVVY